MGERKNPDGFGQISVVDNERKSPHHKTPCAVSLKGVSLGCSLNQIDGFARGPLKFQSEADLAPLVERD